MAHWGRDVRSLLRPSEHLLLVLEGSSLPHASGRAESEDSKAPPPISSEEANMGSSEEPRVILAVVGHMNQAKEESGRSMLNNFTSSFRAKDSPKRVSLH